jgi:hypothetical protein
MHFRAKSNYIFYFYYYKQKNYTKGEKKFIVKMHLHRQQTLQALAMDTLAPLMRGSLQTAARVQLTVDARAVACSVSTCPQVSKSFICKVIHNHIRKIN